MQHLLDGARRGLEHAERDHGLQAQVKLLLRALVVARRHLLLLADRVLISVRRPMLHLISLVIREGAGLVHDLLLTRVGQEHAELGPRVQRSQRMATLEVAARVLLASHAGVRQVRLILVDLGVRAVQRDRLQPIQRLLVLFCVDRVVELLDEEVVVLARPVMLVLERHEVLLALVDAEEVERRRYMLGNFGFLIEATHGLAHLLLVVIVNAEELVRGRYLPLTYLMRILHLYTYKI